jgi:hypothetical protein
MSKFKHRFWTKVFWLAYRHLIEKGIAATGVPGVRDIEFRCDAFDPRPARFDPNPTCETDGHYLCDKCCHKAIGPVEHKPFYLEDFFEKVAKR